LGKSGQISILAGDGLSANDPSATLVVQCRNGFDADSVHLGSGLIDHSQKMTTAAMHMADMNV
jgi:hypothetical protein